METIMFDIDFDSQTPQVLCHPSQKKLISKILNGLREYDLRHHFILFSSGTTGGALKGYALSKESIFENADAVNKHFGITKNDVWGLSLPTYHIGGLSVIARSELLGNRIIDARKWNPELWKKNMEQVTITSIVPTQLYDLIKMEIKPSKNLRYLIVGGDFLSSGLEQRALDFGWPVIRTFGMSEVSSQLASAKFPGPGKLEILPIHDIKINQNNRLLVKSSALFTLKFTLNETLSVSTRSMLSDSEGYYLTEDLVEMGESTLRHLGRVGDEFKISGHLVNFGDLKNILQNELLREGLYGQMEFTLENDERKGKCLVLNGLPGTLKQKRIDHLSALISPVKIDHFQEVERFFRTDLGKLKKDSLV